MRGQLVRMSVAGVGVHGGLLLWLLNTWNISILWCSTFKCIAVMAVPPPEI